METLPPRNEKSEAALRFAMKWSLGVGVLMLLIKVSAYIITGSSAILSDAAESIIHVVAVAFAFYALYKSQQPSSREYPYGQEKIGFVSSGFEGGLICAAAGFIFYESIRQLFEGIEIHQLGWGTGLTVFALVVNGVLGGYLIWVGKREDSIILVANGKHVFTDAVTSVGVIIGLVLVMVTGWVYFDIIFACLVAANIMFSGYGLMQKSFLGLMDYADPKVLANIRGHLDEIVAAHPVSFHQLRYRDAGNHLLVDVHLLFCDTMTIREAHDIATKVENELKQKSKRPLQINTHLEPRFAHDQLHPSPSPENPH